ncbi:hypothetical protein BOX15_Mlig004933g1, partial [Macrostomum lignano]
SVPHLHRRLCQAVLTRGSRWLSGCCTPSSVEHRPAKNPDAPKSAPFFEPQIDWESLSDPVRAAAARQNARQRGADPDLVDAALRLRTESSDGAAAVAAAARLPNWTHPDSPVGGEANSRLVRLIGTAPSTEERRGFDARTLLQNLRLLASRNLSLLTGQRTHYFRGQLAQLETALIGLALDVAREFGFQQIGVPELVPPELVDACGFATQGTRSQVFLTGSMALIGTAEIALAGYLAGRVYRIDQLPVRLCAVSRCYRREISKVEDAMYRVPQFTKVELFSLTSPADSESEHQRLLSVQEAILNQLGLHCRLLDMATEELGNPAYRKFDWEAWLPSEARFGEVCSASNCTDYQSRRLGIGLAGTNLGGFPHTLNGTACAITRTIKALVETHQCSDGGSVALPPALAPYMAPFTNELTMLKRPPMKSMYFARLKRQPML